MGMLEDVLNSSLPKGSLAKPLMIALGALLASGVLTKGLSGSGSSSSSAPAGQSGSTSSAQTGGADSAGGGLLAGLGGLLSKLQQGGAGDIANSWVGSGQNRPISPSQLGTALGSDVISNLAQRTGLSEQELTSQLSQILPAIVDRLTPNGRVPTAAELSGQQ